MNRTWTRWFEDAADGVPTPPKERAHPHLRPITLNGSQRKALHTLFEECVGSPVRYATAHRYYSRLGYVQQLPALPSPQSSVLQQAGLEGAGSQRKYTSRARAAALRTRLFARDRQRRKRQRDAAAAAARKGEPAANLGVTFSAGDRRSALDAPAVQADNSNAAGALALPATDTVADGAAAPVVGSVVQDATSVQASQKPRGLSKPTLNRLVKPIMSLLPKKPEQRAAVLDKLTGRLEVQEVEKLRNSSSNKQAQASAAIVEALQQALSQLDYKTKAGRESAGHLAQQIIMAAVANPALLGQGLISQCARLLSCSRKSLAAALKKRTSSSGLDAWVLRHRKRRQDAKKAKYQALIMEWWDQHTAPFNNKSRVLKGRKKGSEPHVVHIKESSQTKLFLQFRAEHPEVPVGQRLFEQLKPDYVKDLCANHRLTCCCKDHSHMHLEFDSIKAYRAEQARLTGDATIALPGRLSQLLAKGLCPPAPGTAAFYPAGSLACVLGTCSNCSIGRCLALTTAELLDTAPAFKLEYYGYKEYTTKAGEVKKRIAMLEKQVTLLAFLPTFCQELQQYAYHVVANLWQKRQFQLCLETFALEEAVILMGFSENMEFRLQGEIQSEYFLKTQSSLLVAVVHFHAVTSTLDNRVVIKQYHFVMSDDTTHDSAFVTAGLQKINDSIAAVEKAADIKCVRKWSDGCAAQFKGKSSFWDSSRSVELFGWTCTQEFSAAGHSKGPHDGAATLLKSDGAVEPMRQNGVRIINAETWKNHCVANHQQVQPSTYPSRQAAVSLDQRIFHLLKPEEIDRSAPKRGLKTLQGSRSHHNFMFNTPLAQQRQQQQQIPARQPLVGMRRLSCYCNQCRSGNYSACCNIHLVGSIQYKPLVAAAAQQGSVASPPAPQQTQGPTGVAGRRAQPPNNGGSSSSALNQPNHGASGGSSSGSGAPPGNSPAIDVGLSKSSSVLPLIRPGRNTAPSAMDFSCHIAVSVTAQQGRTVDIGCDYCIARVTKGPFMLTADALDGYNSKLTAGERVVECYFYELQPQQDGSVVQADSLYKYNHTRLALVRTPDIVFAGFRMSQLGDGLYSMAEDWHEAVMQRLSESEAAEDADCITDGMSDADTDRSGNESDG